MDPRRPAIVVLIVLTALLAACDTGGDVQGEGLQGDGGGQPGEDTVVAAISAAPDQLDPHLTTASSSFTVNEQIYETLVQTTGDLEDPVYEPELATGWETSQDGLTWTFELREGVTFHNGEAMTAEDVVFSLERVMDEETGAANRYRTAAIDTVTAVDEATVRLELSRPAPNLLANLANGGLAIVEPSTVEDGSIESRPVGTGPFEFAERESGSHVDLAAYQDHWDGAPEIDGVRFRFISEASTALTELQTGSIDWTDNIPPQDITSILDSDDLESASVPSTDYWYLAYNHAREPFDDPRVREALTIGFDRRSVREGAMFDAARTLQTAIPSFSFWHSDYAPWEVDRERARQLLEEAGVEDLSVGLMVSNEFPQTVRAAEVLASEWARIGVDVEIQVEEFPTWLSRNGESDFDIKLLGWVGNVDPNDYYFSQHVTDGDNNTQGYSNQQVDRLLQQARTETDRQRRKQLYDRAARIIVDEQSYVYLYTTDIVQAWRPRLDGYTVRTDGQILFEDVTLDG